MIVGSLFAAESAKAQTIVTVPSVPVVNYVPQRAGLFGLRTTYRPVYSYAPAAPVTTFYAPSTVIAEMPAIQSVPTTTTYMPATPSATTFYTPYAPSPAPVTVYHSPPVSIAPTTSYYTPYTVERPVIIWP